MPYADVSKYVLASEAIPEIARCYFGGDTSKAEADARIAARDGALPVFLDTPVFHQINQDRWYHDHIHWSSISVPLYFPRANLLKIYPDLWRSLQSPDNETTSTSTAGAARSAAVNVDAAERLPVDETKDSDKAAPVSDNETAQDRDEGGRPTYKKEIMEEGLYLLDHDEIDLAKPGKSDWHKVRKRVQKVRDRDQEQVDTGDVRGLSDQTIRRHLKPILNAHGKARG